MTAFIRLTILTLAIGLGHQTAHAKSLSTMLSDSGLTPESLALMQDSAKQLYTSSSKAVGNKNEWSNESTGTNGRVEIVAIKGDCVQLYHHIETGRSGKVSEVRTWRCRTASGDWQLSAEP